MRHFGLIHARPAPRPGEGPHLLDAHVEEVTADLAGCVGRLLHDDRPGVGSCRHVPDDGDGQAVTELLHTCPVVVVLVSEAYERSPVRWQVEAHPGPVVGIDWMAPPAQVVPGGPRRDLCDLFLGRVESDAARREYRARIDEYAAEVVARRLGHGLPPPPAPRSLGRVDLYLLAPHLDRLPGEREPHQYGASSLDWNPFRHAHDRPLRWHLEASVRSLPSRPVVSAFDDGPPHLHLPRPTEPTVLVLDPWALDDAGWRESMRAFDRVHQPWVGVVVAWDPDDPQTGVHRSRLQRQLGETVRRRFRQRRPAVRAGAPIATDLAVLQEAFLTVLAQATAAFWRHHPPPDPYDDPDTPRQTGEEDGREGTG